MSGQRLRLKLVKSPHGRVPLHRRTLRALGLRKLGQSSLQQDGPVLRGMIKQVGYLLQVEEEK